MNDSAFIALFRFEQPIYLLIMLLIPVFIIMGFRSMAGLGKSRRVIAIAMRCLVIIAISLALAGMQRVIENDDLSIVCLVDRSNSVSAELQEKAYDFVRAASQTMGANDSLSLIGFDGMSNIEQLPHRDLKIAFGDLAPPFDPDRTDMTEAMRLAMAMFTTDTMRRVVMLSDGNENEGDVQKEAREYASADVSVDVVPLTYHHDKEVILEQFYTPPTAGAEETVNLRAVLRSTSPDPVPGRIELYHGGVQVPLPDQDGTGSEGRYVLRPGTQAFVLPQQLHRKGTHNFEIKFTPDNAENDTISDNNRGSSFTHVSGQGDILILTTSDNLESTDRLVAAFKREKLHADVQVVDEEGSELDLMTPGLLVFDNVPAEYFTFEQQDQIATYVREFGLGVMMLGGDKSFAAGGWSKGGIEDIMPIEFEPKAKRQVRRGGLVCVMHACEIPQGNKIGERCAIAAVKTLSSLDKFGVVSFQWDGNDQSWDVPFGVVGDRSTAVRKIKSMTMGDMFDFYPLMKDAVDKLSNDPTLGSKHIIVISDFDPNFDTSIGGSGTKLMKRMRENNIACTTIVIGAHSGAAGASLARLMSDGAAKGGQSFAPRNTKNLPQIFIKAATMVRRSLIEEDPNGIPINRNTTLSPIMKSVGIDESVPRVTGYVVTRAKQLPAVQMPLYIKPNLRNNDGQMQDAEEIDPLLAHWQIGLGKTVAFTSGMWPRWGESWGEWSKFSSLWAQAARWSMRQSEESQFDVTTTVNGTHAKIRVDALDKNTDMIYGLTFSGTLVAPSGDVKSVTMRQTGPGIYEGEFDVAESGNYGIGLKYTKSNTGETNVIRTGLSVSYSPEYKELSANLDLLTRISDQTDGRMLDFSQATSVFDKAGMVPARSHRSIWQTLMQLMLVLFILDVAVRRVAISPVEIAHKTRQFISELAGGRHKAEESAATLSSLKGVRDRARGDMAKPPSETGELPRRSAKYEAQQTDSQVSEELSKALGGTSEFDQPVVAKPTRKPTATNQGEYTSRLLAAKRRAQKEREKEAENDDN